MSAYTEYEYRELLKSLFVEAFSYHWAKLDDDARNSESAFACRDALEYDGRWHEIIDGSVPVYTHAAIQTWLNLGMPDAKEEYGMDDKASIIEQVMAGIYMWADQFVGEMFEDWWSEFVADKTQVSLEDA